MKYFKGLALLTMVACVILPVAVTAAVNGTDSVLMTTCVERLIKLEPDETEDVIRGMCKTKLDLKKEAARISITSSPPPTTTTPASTPPSTETTTTTSSTTESPISGSTSTSSAPETQDTATTPSTASFSEGTSESPITFTPTPTTVTDPLPSNNVTAPPSPAPESGESSTLYWVLPLIGLVLIGMAVGGFFTYRKTKRAGYHHSTKSNGDTSNVKGGTDSSA